MTVWVCGGVFVLVSLVVTWGLCRGGALADEGMEKRLR